MSYLFTMKITAWENYLQQGFAIHFWKHSAYVSGLFICQVKYSHGISPSNCSCNLEMFMLEVQIQIQATSFFALEYCFFPQLDFKILVFLNTRLKTAILKCDSSPKPVKIFLTQLYK